MNTDERTAAFRDQHNIALSIGLKTSNNMLFDKTGSNKQLHQPEKISSARCLTPT